MAVKIATIHHLQKFEQVVKGPDGANRLLAIVATLDTPEFVGGDDDEQRETYTCLVGPKLTDYEFLGATCLASISNLDVTGMNTAQCSILSAKADWREESSQVEVSIEVSATGGPAIVTFLFGVMILTVR